MDKRRLIFIGLLVVALGVLFWDKAVSSNSTTAPQAAMAEAVKPGPRPMSGIVPPSLNAMPLDRSVSNSSNPFDAIEPAPQEQSSSNGWMKAIFSLGVAGGQTNPAAAATDTQPSSYRNVFAVPAHVARDRVEAEAEVQMEFYLSGIVRMPGREVARLNGRNMQLGDRIGPYRLVAIESEWVELQSAEDCIRVYVSP